MKSRSSSVSRDDAIKERADEWVFRSTGGSPVRGRRVFRVGLALPGTGAIRKGESRGGWLVCRTSLPLGGLRHCHICPSQASRLCYDIRRLAAGGRRVFRVGLGCWVPVPSGRGFSGWLARLSGSYAARRSPADLRLPITGEPPVLRPPTTTWIVSRTTRGPGGIQQRTQTSG